MKIRTFICIELPETERELLGGLQAKLRRHGARIGWAAPGNIHVTLAFLGDVESERIAEIAAAVARACARSAPFPVRVEGTGGFPSLERPRVLWAGMSGDLAALGALQSDVAGELERLGFARERRAFAAHLTIGRVKDERDPALGAVARDVAGAGLRGTEFIVREVIVMRSELGPTGSRYTPLSRVRVG